jgi:hypothetical protein
VGDDAATLLDTAAVVVVLDAADLADTVDTGRPGAVVTSDDVAGLLDVADLFDLAVSTWPIRAGDPRRRSLVTAGAPAVRDTVRAGGPVRRPWYRQE